MKRRFCSWVVETYFATEIWLPTWFVNWCLRNADAGAMSRGNDRWHRNNPHPSGEPWRANEQCDPCYYGQHWNCAGWCFCPRGQCGK